MQTHNDRPHAPRPAAAKRHGNKAGWCSPTRALALVLLAALAAVASLAPAGQARSTSKGRSQATIMKGSNGVEISCTQIVWKYVNFPSGSYTVNEKITVNGTVLPKTAFQFEGPNGSNVSQIDGPVGKYIIDAEARWSKAVEVEGKSGFDLHANLECEPRGGLTAAKAQTLEGSGLPYAATPLLGEPGQTVDYAILLTNTGNVPLVLGTTGEPITDPHCDAGTLTGGPANRELEWGKSTEYFCKHVLTAADLAVGSYENTALVSAEGGAVPPIKETTNTVIAEVKPVGFKKQVEEEEAAKKKAAEEQQKKAEEEKRAAEGKSGVSSPPPIDPAGTGKSGVLGFSAASVPALKGPQGCVRGSFHVSIRSAGVTSVTFYLDGHKLKTLKARNARKGLLTLMVNPSRLKVGAHRLSARITMAATTAGARASTASRSITVLRCHSNVVTPKFTG
jgi:hypothetical protein